MSASHFATGPTFAEVSKEFGSLPIDPAGGASLVVLPYGSQSVGHNEILLVDSKEGNQFLLITYTSVDDWWASDSLDTQGRAAPAYSYCAPSGMAAFSNMRDGVVVSTGSHGGNAMGFGISLSREDTSRLGISRSALSRVLRFVSWLPDWDGEGAERISPALGLRALEIADRMSRLAGDPFIAPTSDGFLLLEWQLEGGASIEVYVESETEYPDCAILAHGEAVDEVPLSGEADLRRLMLHHSSGVASP